MHKSHWGSDDASRMSLALANQLAKLHQCRRCIAKGKEGIRMLLNSQADACLSTSDTFFFGHLSHTRIREIALGLNTQALESTLTDTTRHHRHISYYRL